MRNVNVNSIGEYIREQREQAKISMRQLAQAAGVSNPYLSQIERGLRKPSADILQQIAKGLRISAEALYVQAGILDDKPADSGVRSALLADPHLAERQKQVLIEIYESFRRENAAAESQQAAAAQAADPAAEAAAAAHAAAEQAAAEQAAAEQAAAEQAAQAAEQPTARAWEQSTAEAASVYSEEAVNPVPPEAPTGSQPAAGPARPDAGTQAARSA